MRKYVKGYGFLSIARNLSNKYKNQLLDTETRCFKNCFQKVVQEAAEATDEVIGNKIADNIMKTKHIIDQNPSVEKIIIQPEKREEILNKLRQVL